MIEFNTLATSVCGFDAALVDWLGVQKDGLGYSFWKIFLTPIITSGFLAAWMTAFPVLRRHGFGQPVWSLVGWFVGAMALAQMIVALAEYMKLLVVPCGTVPLVSALLAALLCTVAYGVHLWRGNKGSFAGFMTYVVGPAVFETVAGTRAMSLFMLDRFEVALAANF